MQSPSEIKIIDSEYHTGRDDSSVKDLNTTKQTLLSGTQNTTMKFNSIPESPIGDCIDRALKDVPVLPAKFDDNDTIVGGKNVQDESQALKFNRFMLERLKKQSILNHPVFNKKGTSPSKEKV